MIYPNLKFRILLLAMLIFSGLTAQVDIIPFGSSWKYYDDGDEPNGSWEDFGYDDSSWDAGNGQLGYGDNDQATLINSTDASGGNLSAAYFRHEFTIQDVNDLTNFSIDLIFDDGAIVYINGIEAVRLRMKQGNVNYGTYSQSQSIENELYTFTPTAASFMTGTNVISVEVHQHSNNSSDISFDFKLSADVNEYLDFGSGWDYYDSGDKPADDAAGNSWADVQFDDSSWTAGTAEFGWGDGDETTEVSTVNTVYFRSEAFIFDASSLQNYFFNIKYDDAYALYVNGTEVKRENLHTCCPLLYSTAAATHIGENATNIDTIDASYFVDGLNTIAVEIHDGQFLDLSFDLEMTAGQPYPAEITRGPYLQKGSHSSVVVKWRTDVPVESVVKYGPSPANLSSVASNNTPTTEHEVEITGLTDATKYYYSVNDQNGNIVPGAADLYFKTHPIPGTVVPTRAWILGDPGTANNDQRNVRNAYYSYTGTEHTDMMLFLGDNAYPNGTDDQYQNAMFENMYEDKMKNTIAWSTLGNHDARSVNTSSQSGVYYDVFAFPKAGESGGEASGTEAYYSFDYGNVHYIILDSNDSPRDVTGDMYNWALMDIQATTRRWIVAMFHHPPYTKGSHNSDQDSDSNGRLKDMREIFVPMLEDNGVDLVLSGHSHSYERSFLINGHYGKSLTFDPNTHFVGNGSGSGKADGDGAYTKAACSSPMGEGAVYITTGSAGKVTGTGSLNHPAMYYSKKDLGSTVLEVHGDTLNVKFVRNNNAIDDYFTILKSDIVAGAPCDDGLSCTADDVYDANCGCAGTEVDTDGDNTSDCNDACPNDPNKILPGTCGCGVAETDSDMDGTKDCMDGCPTDVLKTNPGICGCGVPDTDTDLDGTADCNDGCPSDKFKTAPGACGCGVADTDTDGDNTADCLDACPNDPLKISPGSCGCGIVEDTGDNDGDNVINCMDECPNDPNKTAPGVCGCGVIENAADSDNDGTIDCFDECPTDPTRTIADACGCGSSFVDSDNDGICDDVDDCVLLIHVNPFSSTDTTYEVIETISSDAILNGGSNMNFSAGKEIELQANFEVKSGATFHAYIQGCTN